MRFAFVYGKVVSGCCHERRDKIGSTGEKYHMWVVNVAFVLGRLQLSVRGEMISGTSLVDLPRWKISNDQERQCEFWYKAQI
jgi:hypothetical protein